jgi:hypothetical protein
MRSGVQGHGHRENPYIKLGERHRDVETENESDIATNVRLGGFGPSHRVASGLPRGGRTRGMRRFFCLCAGLCGGKKQRELEEIRVARGVEGRRIAILRLWGECESQCNKWNGSNSLLQ